jgi:hypothetical protein
MIPEPIESDVAVSGPLIETTDGRSRSATSTKVVAALAGDSSSAPAALTELATCTA